MNFFSSRSSIYFFSSANSAGAILYGAIEIGPAPGMRSIEKSTCLLGGNSGISSGKISAYSSTTGMLLICSTVPFFSPWATIMKQVAPASTSPIAFWVDINSSPKVSGKITLRRPQSITTWLPNNQSIPRITSKPSIGKQMRFTLNLRPTTFIKQPTQTELVATWPEDEVETNNSQSKSRFFKLSFVTHASEIKECVAPESNNTNTTLPNNRQGSRIRLLDYVASVVVRAKTLPAALARSAGDAVGFFAPGLFFSRQLLAKCPGLSPIKHLRRSPDPPTPPTSWGQFLFDGSTTLVARGTLGCLWSAIRLFICLASTTFFWCLLTTGPGPFSRCSALLACSTKTRNLLSLKGVTTLFSSCLSPRSNFKHFHSSVMFFEEYLAKCSNLLTYSSTVMSPCYNARNSASLSCLAISGKYFSRKRILKFAQDTGSSLVPIYCCMPAHQYSASSFSRYVANNSFCSSSQFITLKIFSHLRSHASASSWEALLVNSAGLWRKKSSTVGTLTSAMVVLGCAATGTRTKNETLQLSLGRDGLAWARLAGFQLWSRTQLTQPCPIRTTKHTIHWSYYTQSYKHNLATILVPKKSKLRHIPSVQYRKYPHSYL